MLIEWRRVAGFVKLNLHPYKAGGKQGVYQVCWQLSVMRTKDNHKYIMMYEIDTNEGEVRRMMREVGLSDDRVEQEMPCLS